ncbi:glycosyltransferase family 9 protein, partial [Burkholderia multivorans]|uniref:glycosyltransferase family 9 protein n=1 Tax=Burkholderia multivorans TaxID=87883 RepID=UPI0023EC66B5
RALLILGSEGAAARAPSVPEGAAPMSVRLGNADLVSVRALGAAIGRAALVVGVDTGFVHMAHALGRPTVMIFVATSRHHCGIGGAPHALSIGEQGVMPTVDDALRAIDTVGPAYGAFARAS